MNKNILSVEHFILVRATNIRVNLKFALKIFILYNSCLN